MKIIIDIDVKKDKVIKTFIDEDGKSFSETWVRKNFGRGTVGKGIGPQLEKEGYFDEFVDAIENMDIDDIWDIAYGEEYK
jgi:hypothetical protein